MFDKAFATAINCMDGRIQLPVINYLKNNNNIDYIDMITEPGPVKVLSECKDIDIINSIIKRVVISVTKHNSNLIAVVGHYDCIGNPVDKDTQIKQIFLSKKVIKSWFSNIQIIGLWVDKNWEVNSV